MNQEKELQNIIDYYERLVDAKLKMLEDEEIEQLGKYTRTTWTVNAKNVGAPARAVYTKIQIKGVTRTVYKDTYNKNNKLLHRKYKICRGRPC